MLDNSPGRRVLRTCGLTDLIAWKKQRVGSTEISPTHLDAVDDGVVPRRVVLLIGVDGSHLCARLEEVHDSEVRLLSLLHLLFDVGVEVVGLGCCCCKKKREVNDYAVMAGASE